MYNNQQNRNWICLTKNVKIKSDSEKDEHIAYLLKRRNELPSDGEDKKPEFLQLLHRIRALCIIKAYYPGCTKYDSIFSIDNHPGWDDFMTPQERSLLNEFKSALISIEKYRDTRKFDIVDKKFGEYRYNKWIQSRT